MVAAIEKDPLMRAFRCDKMTLAALEATLRIDLNETAALAEIPVLHLLALPLEELHCRAESLAERLQGIAGLASVESAADVAYVGGGSLPDQARRRGWCKSSRAASATPASPAACGSASPR